MFTSILGLISLGLALLVVAVLTYVAWKKKVNEKFEQRNARKVMSSELKTVAKNCTNRTTLDKLDEYEAKGYTHVMAAMDENDEVVGDVEIVKAPDSQIASKHGYEGCIVIER